MYGCQQVLVKKNQDLLAILEFLCSESHKLTNMGIYYARQLYFKAKTGIGKYDLEKYIKTAIIIKYCTRRLHNKY